MEFFTDYWLLWAAVFAPSAAWLLAEKARGAPLPLGPTARVAACASGVMLVFAAIHFAAELGVGLLFS